MSNYTGTYKGIYSYNLVNKFLIQLLPLLRLVFVVPSPNAFWYGKNTYPKGSSQKEIIFLPVTFYLPYSNYRCIKISFYSCCYQNQNVSLVSYSCRSCSSCVAVVPLVPHSCCTHVARVALVSLVLSLILSLLLFSSKKQAGN